jgi:guanylate kinase
MRPKAKKRSGKRRKARAQRRGLMFVLSSPSGAGKTTLTRLLLARDPRMRLSISATTRPRRPSEVNGVHYHFVNRGRFAAMRKRSDLLEWARVHGNYYGTPKAPVERALRSASDVLFDIDWQGTLQLYDKARPDVVSIFILPPSIAELRRRLARRAEDKPTSIRKRLVNALHEIKHWKEYDYVLINDDLDRCFAKVRAIVAAERLRRAGKTGKAIERARGLRRARQPGLAARVKRLLVKR